MHARWIVGLCVLAGSCADDTEGEPNGGSEGVESSTGDDAMASGSGSGSADADADADADDATGAADSSGADTLYEPDLDDIVGDWQAIETYNPNRPDHVLVRADGTATAEFRYLVDDAPWEVRLEATIVVSDLSFLFTFVCDGTQPECVALGFDSYCRLIDEHLVCPAPDWYYKLEIVFERMP